MPTPTIPTEDARMGFLFAAPAVRFETYREHATVAEGFDPDDFAATVRARLARKES